MASPAFVMQMTRQADHFDVGPSLSIIEGMEQGLKQGIQKGIRRGMKKGRQKNRGREARRGEENAGERVRYRRDPRTDRTAV